MNFTHIIMPRKCLILPIREALTCEDIPLNLRTAMQQTAESNPEFKVVFFGKGEWTYHINTQKKFNYLTIKELPPNAQEFPFGVDKVDSVVGESGISYAGAIKGCGNSPTTTEGYNNIVVTPNPPTQLVEESLVGKWFSALSREDESLTFKVTGINEEGLCRRIWWDEELKALQQNESGNTFTADYIVRNYRLVDDLEIQYACENKTGQYLLDDEIPF